MMLFMEYMVMECMIYGSIQILILLNNYRAVAHFYD